MYKAKVIQLKKLNHKIHFVRFKIKKNNRFEFKTGQFISIRVGNNQYRPYSIASSNKNSNYLDLVISAKHNGMGANYIKNLKIDDVICFNAPYGRFTLSEIDKDNYIFIATGAGIAPIYPMITDLLSTNKDKNITLYFGLQFKKDVFYKKELDKLTKKHKKFKYYYCLSQQKIIKENFLNNRVTKVLDNLFKSNTTEINEHMTDNKYNIEVLKNETEYYICGNPYMVKETREILADNNVSNDNIHFEKFTIQNL